MSITTPLLACGLVAALGCRSDRNEREQALERPTESSERSARERGVVSPDDPDVSSPTLRSTRAGHTVHETGADLYDGEFGESEADEPGPSSTAGTRPDRATGSGWVPPKGTAARRWLRATGSSTTDLDRDSTRGETFGTGYARPTGTAPETGRTGDTTIGTDDDMQASSSVESPTGTRMPGGTSETATGTGTTTGTGINTENAGTGGTDDPQR